MSDPSGGWFSGAGMVLGGLGSLMSSNAQGDAADAYADSALAAAQVQAEQNQKTLDFQKEVYQQALKNAAPYQSAGYGALANLVGLANVTPGAVPSFGGGGGGGGSAAASPGIDALISGKPEKQVLPADKRNPPPKTTTTKAGGTKQDGKKTFNIALSADDPTFAAIYNAIAPAAGGKAGEIVPGSSAWMKAQDIVTGLKDLKKTDAKSISSYVMSKIGAPAGGKLPAGEDQWVDAQGAYPGGVKAGSMGDLIAQSISKSIGSAPGATDSGGGQQQNQQEALIQHGNVTYQPPPEWQDISNPYKSQIETLLATPGFDAKGSENIFAAQLQDPANFAKWQATPEQMALDPGYAFQLAEGNKALKAKQSLLGGLLSGGGVKEAIGFSQGLAATTANDIFNRYFIQQQAQVTNALQGTKLLAAIANTNKVTGLEGYINAANQAANIASLNQAGKQQAYWNTQNDLWNKNAALAGLGQVSTGQAGAAGQSAANLFGQVNLSTGNALSDAMNSGGYMQAAAASSSPLGNFATQAGNFMMSSAGQNALKGLFGNTSSGWV